MPRKNTPTGQLVDAKGKGPAPLPFERDADDPTGDAPKPKLAADFGNARVPLYQQIAGPDTTSLLYWRWPGAEQDFPQEPWLRNVRIYYPNAIGGPLAVDEPRYENERVACKRKSKALKARGIRYLVYERGMSMDDAMEGINNGLVTDGSPGQTSDAALRRANG